MIDTDVFLRAARRENPTLSSTSTRLADLVERSIPDASSYRICRALLTVSRLTNLGHELIEVPIRLLECDLALELGPECNLKQLRCWQTAPFQLFMEVVRQVDLKSWHTPNYTHSSAGHTLRQFGFNGATGPRRPRALWTG